MSHYSTLGIMPVATSKEIHEAFLTSALRAHPDSGGSDFQLQEVLHAFEMLCEQRERRSLVRKKHALADQEPLGARGHEPHVPNAIQWVWKRTSAGSTLPRLCKLLSSLPADRRQFVLQQCFSQQQRLQLERWMLARPVTKQVRGPNSRVSRSSKATRRRVQSVVRVTRQNKYRYYMASAAVEGLRLVTRTVGSLEVALTFHSILVVIKQRTRFLRGNFEARFRAALSSTFSEFKADPESMGLKFIVSLRVLWMKTPLRTPAYLVASQLDNGLQALHRLRKARGSVRNCVLRAVNTVDLDEQWTQIRGEYLDVMVEAGCKKQSVLDRLELLDRERASKLQEQSRRWLTAKGKRLGCSKKKSGRTRKCDANADLIIQRQIEALLSRWNMRQH